MWLSLTSTHGSTDREDQTAMPRFQRAFRWRTRLTEKVGPRPELMRAYGAMFISDMQRAQDRAQSLRMAAVAMVVLDFDIESEE
jgi:hypothetical protein